VVVVVGTHLVAFFQSALCLLDFFAEGGDIASFRVIVDKVVEGVVNSNNDFKVVIQVKFGAVDVEMICQVVPTEANR